MVAMPTCYVNLKNVGVPTKSVIRDNENFLKSQKKRTLFKNV